MGKVLVTAKIENLDDLFNAKRGLLADGQVPLELLDWVVDPKGQRLIGNPEHGGEHMMDVF